MNPELAVVGAAQFVSLTTFRKDGTPVATPVWIAKEGHSFVVTTEEGTGKVKRIRRNPQVTLEPCSRSGKVEPGATLALATAEVVTDPAGVASGNAALADRYGVQFKVVMAVEKVVGMVKRTTKRRVILRITSRH